MSVGIHVLSNRFGELARSLDRTVESALDTGVKTLVAGADPLTAVDTGAVRANKVFESSAGYRSIVWAQSYSVYVHEGTYKMAARPFARMAMPAALEAINAELSRFGS